MLTEQEHGALTRWYSRPEALEKARRLYEEQLDEELEEYLHMMCLLPLSRHAELPDYLRAPDGGPLFPTNLNPGADLAKWQDAIEVGWEVVQRELGISHDEIHRRIAATQQSEWRSFLERAEARDKPKP